MLVGHPFETIKVRMQALKSAKFASTTSAVKTTVRKEGLLALYKGLSPQVPSTLLKNTANVGLFRFFCDRIQETDPTQPLTLGQIAQAATVAGMLHAPVTNAFDLVRIRCQIQCKHRRLDLTPLQSVRRAIRYDGLCKGVFKGTGFALLVNLSNAAYFVTFEGLMRTLCQGKPRHAVSSQDLSYYSFVSGGCAGVVAWFLCFPADSIKSRFQADSLSKPEFKTAWHAVTKSLRGGIRPLFRGLTPCLLRAFIANGTGFATIELVSRAVSAPNPQNRSSNDNGLSA